MSTCNCIWIVFYLFSVAQCNKFYDIESLLQSTLSIILKMRYRTKNITIIILVVALLILFKQLFFIRLRQGMYVLILGDMGSSIIPLITLFQLKINVLREYSHFKVCMFMTLKEWCISDFGNHL